MSTYFYIQQIDDKKNEGKKIAAAFSGTKIGFPFEDLGDYEGLYCADKVVEKDNFFKFSGKKVSGSVPSFEDIYSYCESNSIVPVHCDIISNTPIIQIECGKDYRTILLSFVEDAGIITVSKFNTILFNMCTKNDYILRYKLLRSKCCKIPEGFVEEYIIKNEDGTTSLYRWFDTLGLGIEYISTPLGSSYPAFIFFYDEETKSSCQEVYSRVCLDCATTKEIENALVTGQYSDTLADDIRSEMKEQFISSRHLSDTEHHVINIPVKINGSTLQFTMFNRDCYNRFQITDLEKEEVRRSKGEYENLIKQLAKKLNTASFIEARRRLNATLGI